MKHNAVESHGIYWTATILHQCGHEREFLRPRASHNNGDGCTIGKARHIVRAEAGMLCPDCRITDHQRQQWRESKQRQRAGNAAPQRGPVPVYGETMRRYQVTMPPEMADHFRTVGSGNLSAGVRAVCAAHAALAMAEFDGAAPETLRALAVARDDAERTHRASK